jgi:hypothetical protein
MVLLTEATWIMFVDAELTVFLLMLTLPDGTLTKKKQNA